MTLKHNIKHVISSESDFSLKPSIARDKGKKASEILGLESISFNDVNFHSNADGYFFDPILSSREIEALINLINYYRENNIKKYFLFHFVDLHRDILEPWLTIPSRINLLSKASPSVGFFLGYEPKDCLKELLDISSFERTAILPHFYVPEFAREIQHDKRKNKVLLCGAPIFGGDRPSNFHQFALKTSSCYPHRVKLEDFARSDDPLAQLIDYHPHPGYFVNEQGERVRGDKNYKLYAFENFIDLISQYRFFFVEPSIFDIDLRKYSEVAEAGSCPVGVLPSRLGSAPIASLRMDYDIGPQIQAITSMSEKQSETIALEYRKYIESDRTREKFPEILNHMIEMLDHSWENK